MDLVAVFTIGRQFPDKAIDLIDEDCTITKGGQAVVSPAHVAQVAFLFTLLIRVIVSM